MGVDLFGIGKSALLGFQQALSTVGHNISNVNTEGYSRQQVLFGTNRPFYTTRGWLGTGVQPTEVRRIYSAFVNAQVTRNTSLNEFQQSLKQLTGSLDYMAGQEATSLNTPLQAFFNSVQEVATSPADIAAREVMLGESESLVKRFRLMNDEFDRLQNQTNSQIEATVAEINSMAEDLARLNEQIIRDIGSGQIPNDLMDRRELLINQLAEQVAVQTVEQDNGAINVFIGTGQALVVDTRANRLLAAPLGADPNQLDIAIDAPAGPIRITGQITGGKLAAQLEFRDVDLSRARNEIGRVAIGLAIRFNEQHAQGLDLNGNIGSDYFAVPQPMVLDDPGNSTYGISSITVQYEDISQLTTDNYRMSYDGVNWTLVNLTSGQTVPLTPSGGDFLADGMRITPDPGASAGDSYEIRPTANGALQIDLLIDNPRLIAAASTHASRALDSNTGTGLISDVTVTNAADPNFTTDLTIVFDNPPNTYRINAGPPQAYTPGAVIAVNGIEFTIDGTPAAGDTFTVTYNSNAVGNGDNALKLAGIQQEQILEGGNETVFSAYDEYLARVGTRSRQVNSNAESQQVLLDQAVAQREGISGVNLDEEAANLQQYQQAYQAAAQVISTADNLFNTLLRAVGG